MLKMRESYEEVKSCGQATYFVKRQSWDSETDDVREGMRMKENEDSPSIRTDGALQGKSISITPKIITFREALQSIHLVLKR